MALCVRILQIPDARQGGLSLEGTGTHPDPASEHHPGRLDPTGDDLQCLVRNDGLDF